MRLNRIGDEGGVRLCRGLVKNQGLQRLSLAGNSLEFEFAAEILPVLRRHPTLTALDVSSNGIPEEGGAEFTKAVVKNECLLAVDVRYNEFSAVDIQVVRLLFLVTLCSSCPCFLITNCFRFFLLHISDLGRPGQGAPKSKRSDSGRPLRSAVVILPPLTILSFVGPPPHPSPCSFPHLRTPCVDQPTLSCVSLPPTEFGGNLRFFFIV